MSRKKDQRKSGGDRKHGRNKRPVDSATSAYARGKITFEGYCKQKGIKIKARN